MKSIIIFSLYTCRLFVVYALLRPNLCLLSTFVLCQFTFAFFGFLGILNIQSQLQLPASSQQQQPQPQCNKQKISLSRDFYRHSTAWAWAAAAVAVDLLANWRRASSFIFAFSLRQFSAFHFCVSFSPQLRLLRAFPCFSWHSLSIFA